MDPGALGSYEWSEISKLVTNIVIMVGLIIFFAANMIIGHIVIPSMVASHHLPRDFQKSRPLFYGTAIISFGVAIYVAFLSIELGHVLSRFWDNYWI